MSTVINLAFELVFKVYMFPICLIVSERDLFVLEAIDHAHLTVSSIKEKRAGSLGLERGH